MEPLKSLQEKIIRTRMVQDPTREVITIDVSHLSPCKQSEVVEKWKKKLKSI